MDDAAAGSLGKIHHLVVIYLENHSFDNLYGEFPGANGLADGIGVDSQRDLRGAVYSTLPPVRDTLGMPFPAPPLPNRPFAIDQYVHASTEPRAPSHHAHHRRSADGFLRVVGLVFGGMERGARRPCSPGFVRVPSPAVHLLGQVRRRHGRPQGPLKDETDFLAAVAMDSLPAVSFVKPGGLENEHPGYSNMVAGDEHAIKLITAIQKSPCGTAR